MNKYYLTFIALVITSFNTQAAEFCATSSAEIQAALTTAQSNNQHDVIKIAEGIYDSPGSEYSYTETAGWDLTISGGWSDFFGNPCGQQLAANPFSTVLDGNHNSRIMNIVTGGNADITISSLTFINGGDSNLLSGGGLRLWVHNNPHTGTVVIERSAFINNHAEKSSAITFLPQSTRNYIRNNIFALNQTFNGNYSIEINQDVSSGLYFTNNTVYSNSGDNNNNYGGFVIFTAPTSEALVANNVLYDNGDRDLQIIGTGDVYLKNNDIGIQSGSAPIESSGNFSAPPHFKPGILSYEPDSFSQLLNKGTAPCNICPIPIPFDEFWILGMVDAVGDTRVQHGRVDIGAVESSEASELIFINSFE